jgi:membrane associated rhomboid family serine protease
VKAEPAEYGEAKAVVFPLYDDNPFRRARTPYVTWGLIALNVIIFLIEVGSPESQTQAIFASFAATPAEVFHQIPNTGQIPAELTLISYMFLHGGWEHILGNMIYLWVFGDDIEDALGPARFLAFYLAAGVAAALVFSAFNPQSTMPLVGASGAVSGILAAYLMLRPCAKVSVFVFRIIVRVRAYWAIGGWVLLQLISIAGQANDGVAYAAHIGGLVAGGLLFLVMRPQGVQLLECVENPKVSTN